MDSQNIMTCNGLPTTLIRTIKNNWVNIDLLFVFNRENLSTEIEGQPTIDQVILSISINIFY
jgi:hypothetical protein